MPAKVTTGALIASLGSIDVRSRRPARRFSRVLRQIRRFVDTTTEKIGSDRALALQTALREKRDEFIRSPQYEEFHQLPRRGGFPIGECDNLLALFGQMAGLPQPGMQATSCPGTEVRLHPGILMKVGDKGLAMVYPRHLQSV